MREYVFGQNPTANQSQIPVAINDPERHISRTHCKITLYDDNSLVIEDLGSKNGTFVNGTRITNPCRISLKDSVILADKAIDLKQHIKIDVIIDKIDVIIDVFPANFTFAEWVNRFAQYLIDGFISGGILTIFSLITSRILSELMVASGLYILVFLMSFIIYIGFSLLIVHFYFVNPISSTGQTMGAKIMKIQFVDAETLNYPSKGKIWLRTICYALSGLIFGIGFLMPLWNDKKQALHDIIANTIVINKS